jgi:N6-adenosine-specific RNA methylase IME4
MPLDEIAALPVRELAAEDCALFVWGVWVLLPSLFDVIEAWGFTYKTCAFDWMKADPRQIDMFKDEGDVQMGLGYWTRANTEPCLLATRGSPKRLNADVRQGIIAPRREHSRKPEGVHARIERLVDGPFVELFARESRPGWDCWGNEVGKFDAEANGAQSYALAIAASREMAVRQGKLAPATEAEARQAAEGPVPPGQLEILWS